MNAIFQGPVTDQVHDSQHPWCVEAERIMAKSCVDETVMARVLSELGHALHNDSPQPVTFATLLTLGAKTLLADSGWTASVHVRALGGDVIGEGPTVEEAVLDAYARKRQAEGHPLVDRIADLLVKADAPCEVVDGVRAIVKRIRVRFSVLAQGTVAARLAASPSPCPCCARGRLLPVRYTDHVTRDGIGARVINLEGDYCSACGETTVAPAAARRNESRILTTLRSVRGTLRA